MFVNRQDARNARIFKELFLVFPGDPGVLAVEILLDSA